MAQQSDNINLKKPLGIDAIPLGPLKELPKKAIIMLTYLVKACLRLQLVPECFKIAEIIMLKKPNKQAKQITYYRPILTPVKETLNFDQYPRFSIEITQSPLHDRSMTWGH